MACNLADQRPCLTEGETQLCYVGFADELRDGELLTGTPTLADANNTGDLTFANQGLNGSEADVSGVTHAASEAVVFKLSGFQASNAPYTLKITVSTDSSPARTLVRYARFDVQGAPS